MRNFIGKTFRVIKDFHEDIVVENFPPRHMTTEEYRQKLKVSEKHGLSAYMR